MTPLILAFVFFLIAAIYASVGLGGGSSYIALLLVAGLAIADVRFFALVCNILVVGGASFKYISVRLVPWRKVLPIVGLSVPMAFLGGTIALDGRVYTGLAGIALLLASVLLLTERSVPVAYSRKPTAMLGAVGGGIGFLSGLIGIGGGIFLAPLLHVTRWESAKLISATASLFILANSLAGLLGQLQQRPSVDLQLMLMLGAAVFIGGQLGTHYNIKLLPAHYIRRITGTLVGVVAVRLLYTTICS